MPPRLLQRALPLAALLAGSQQQQAATPRIPPAEFLFGFAQAEGSGTIPPKETVLTLDEMVSERLICRIHPTQKHNHDSPYKSQRPPAETEILRSGYKQY